MREARSGWTRTLGAGAAIAVALFSVGCGAYEPEPEYPQQQQAFAPPPASETDPAVLAQQRAAEATAPGAAPAAADVAIGVDTSDDEYPDTDPSALSEFRPVLEDHGQWVEDPSYGTVWVPSAAEVGADFQPYVSAGHWTYADDTDYVWVSDYSWGWAPFHYGRWVLLPGHGWSWIPGRRYAGAWVTWRYGAGYDYVGWAPMGPSWYWWHGAPYAWSFGWYDPDPYYAFCHRDHLYGGGGYVVRGPAAHEHMGRTSDHVPARPTVGGPSRVVARPSVGGPRPSDLGNAAVVVPPPRGGAGYARAVSLASPRTAVVAGAAAPTYVAAGRAPASVGSIPHVSANAVVAPPSAVGVGGPVRGPGAMPSRTVSSPRVGGDQAVRPVAGGIGAERVARPVSSPSVRGSSPSVPAPSPRGPVVRSAPSVASRPVVSSSPPRSVAAPSPAPRSVAAPSRSVSAPSVSHSSPSHSAPARSSSGSRRR